MQNLNLIQQKLWSVTTVYWQHTEKDYNLWLYGNDFAKLSQPVLINTSVLVYSARQLHLAVPKLLICIYLLNCKFHCNNYNHTLLSAFTVCSSICVSNWIQILINHWRAAFVTRTKYILSTNSVPLLSCHSASPLLYQIAHMYAWKPK